MPDRHQTCSWPAWVTLGTVGILPLLPLRCAAAAGGLCKLLLPAVKGGLALGCSQQCAWARGFAGLQVTDGDPFAWGGLFARGACGPFAANWRLQQLRACCSKPRLHVRRQGGMRGISFMHLRDVKRTVCLDLGRRHAPVEGCQPAVHLRGQRGPSFLWRSCQNCAWPNCVEQVLTSCNHHRSTLCASGGGVCGICICHCPCATQPVPFQ